MGYEAAAKLTRTQLQKRIRDASKETVNVVFTGHAAQRMKQRAISRACVIECLRRGRLLRQPEPNFGKGSLECRMEHYCAGRNIGAVVALCDEDPSMVVVTVMHVG